MYSLLIKDRAYPISVFLSYMMLVKEITRSEAILMLTHAAVGLDMRKQLTPPANNTVSEWGRSTDTPLWAVVSAMKLLEHYRKVPYSDQEWAFWAFATAECSTCSEQLPKYTGKKGIWFKKAMHFRSMYESRGNLRKKHKDCSWPNVAAKVEIFAKGNELDSFTIPHIYMDISQSLKVFNIVDEKLKANIEFTLEDIESITKNELTEHELLSKLITTIQELTNLGVTERLSNGNIKFTL